MKALALGLVLGAATLSSAAHAQETFGSPTIDERAGELPPQPPPPPAEPPRAEPVERPGLPVGLRLDGGYAYRKLFDLHVDSADFGFALGVRNAHHMALWWASRFSRGDTNDGLHVYSFRTGGELEGVFDPFRFRVGLSILWVDVERESRNESLTAFGVDGRVFVRVDAYRSDAFALFVRGSIDSGIDGSGNWAFWGPGIGLGVEFGVAGERKPSWK